MGEGAVVGFGFGDGDGYGFGDVDGFGDGYGFGYDDYWRSCIATYVACWPARQRQQFYELQTQNATMAYWTSTADGYPTHGGQSDQPAVPGLRERVAGPLQICTRHALHASFDPCGQWSGARVWIVALLGRVVNDGDKLAALERVIIGECV